MATWRQEANVWLWDTQFARWEVVSWNGNWGLWKVVPGVISQCWVCSSAEDGKRKAEHFQAIMEADMDRRNATEDLALANQAAALAQERQQRLQEILSTPSPCHAAVGQVVLDDVWGAREIRDPKRTPGLVLDDRLPWEKGPSSPN